MIVLNETPLFRREPVLMFQSRDFNPESKAIREQSDSGSNAISGDGVGLRNQLQIGNDLRMGLQIPPSITFGVTIPRRDVFQNPNIAKAYSLPGSRGRHGLYVLTFDSTVGIVVGRLTDK